MSSPNDNGQSMKASSPPPARASSQRYAPYSSYNRSKPSDLEMRITKSVEGQPASSSSSSAPSSSHPELSKNPSHRRRVIDPLLQSPPPVRRATPVESHDPLRMKPSYDISPPKVERRGPRINPWPITAPKVGGPNEKETDPHRLAQRQKQIDFGKNTLGYERYLKLVPKDQRGPEHPQTPDIHRVIGRDNFLAECRHWRRQLHVWDPEQSEADGTVAPEAIDSDLFADMDVDSGAASSSAAAAAPPASSSLSGLNIPDVSEPWE